MLVRPTTETTREYVYLEYKDYPESSIYGYPVDREYIFKLLELELGRLPKLYEDVLTYKSLYESKRDSGTLQDWEQDRLTYINNYLKTRLEVTKEFLLEPKSHVLAEYDKIVQGIEIVYKTKVF